jgi:hypothetical protein
MSDDADPSGLPPLRWQVQAEDGRTVLVEMAWRDEADMLERLLARHRARVVAVQEQMQKRQPDQPRTAQRRRKSDPPG